MLSVLDNPSQKEVAQVLDFRHSQTVEGRTGGHWEQLEVGGRGSTDTIQLPSGAAEVFWQFSRWTLNHSLERKWSGCQSDWGWEGVQLASSNWSDCVMGLRMRIINLDYFLSQLIWTKCLGQGEFTSRWKLQENWLNVQTDINSPRSMLTFQQSPLRKRLHFADLGYVSMKNGMMDPWAMRDPPPSLCAFTLVQWIIYHCITGKLAALIMEAISTASPPDSEYPHQEVRCRVITIKQ